MIENQKEDDSAPPTPQLEQIQLENNNIGYNCPECSSLIEILAINEDNNTIEFNCINNNNHSNNIKIKEYLENMKKYNDNKNLNEICKNHNKINDYIKYMNYCFDCKLHLCKECLKSKIHIIHNKTYIFELQPDEEDLNIIKKKFQYYDNYIKNIKFEKENKIKELKNKLNNDINKEKLNLKKCIDINKINKEEELKFNNKKYIDDLIKIKIKYEEEMKQRKLKYEKENRNINSKYNLITNKKIIINNNKIKQIDYYYNNKINNLIYIFYSFYFLQFY